ncbi:hypothetical protein [Streptomyces sp. NPDC051662]|uniref:hypothetical protein n=1 Tax=Streptomyces sp. NPDC051662 TaxID=3154750 RepID=UPI003431AB64
MEPELTLTAADVEHLTDWGAPPLDAVPHEMRPDIVAYYLAIAGIPDCFDSLDDGDLALAAGCSATDGHATPATPSSIDSFVRAHLAMIDTWWLAIDSLDAAVRGPYGPPPWAQKFVKGELQSLFDATTALQRAVITHHHGSAGPQLSRAYGYQYALSNGTVAPF